MDVVWLWLLVSSSDGLTADGLCGRGVFESNDGVRREAR